MAWSSAGIVPNHPGGRSPHNVPIPVTPMAAMPGLPGQHQQAGGGYLMQPQHQMYGQQQLQVGVPAGYSSPYHSPVQLQQPVIQLQQPQHHVQQPMMYAQNGYMVAGAPGMMMYADHQQHHHRPKLREDNPPMDKFLDGAFYGPVLDGMTATILGVKLQLNPVLKHYADDTDENRIFWDVLDNAKEAHLVEVSSGEPKSKAWSDRDQAATFPRMNQLTLISPHIPRPIDVKGTGKGGTVTCADIITSIQVFMMEKISRGIYDRLAHTNPIKKNKIDFMYHHNRSGKEHTPGPAMGPGVRNGDYLEEWTTFDGLDDDPVFVRRASGMGKLISDTESREYEREREKRKLVQRPIVGTLVLKLDHRYDGLDLEVPVYEPPTATNASPKDRAAEFEVDSEEESEEEEVHRKKKKGKKRVGAGMAGMAGMGMYPPGMMPGMGMPGMMPQVMPQGMPQGMPMMYAAAPQGYVAVQQVPQVQSPGQYIIPLGGAQGRAPVGGYVPSNTPAMAAYQQLPGQGYPGLGTPLPPSRRL